MRGLRAIGAQPTHLINVTAGDRRALLPGGDAARMGAGRDALEERQSGAVKAQDVDGPGLLVDRRDRGLI